MSNIIISYHFEQIKRTKEKLDLVAGNILFTSRNLNLISKDYYHYFNNKNTDIYNSISLETWLYNIFENYYWSYSPSNKKEFINESLKLLMKKLESDLIKNLEIDKEIQFKEIREILIGMVELCL